MGWLTDAQLQSAIAARLGLAGSSSLPAHWLAIEPDANASAQNDITGIMVGRGFSASQVQTFDQLQTWHRQLTLGYAFQEGALRGEQYQQAPIDKMREVLEKLPKEKFITIGGILAIPQGPAGINIGTGAEDTSQDRIQLTPPDGTGQFVLPQPGDGSGSQGTVL